MPVRTVLQHADITRALTRISHEILESNRGSDDLVILGIPTRGVTLAQRISAIIQSVDSAVIPAGALDVTMYRDDLAQNPTIRAALDALGDLGRPRAVRLAVLVDRGHREFPIRADFVGKNLPSSAEERINVRLEEIDGTDEVTIG